MNARAQPVRSGEDVVLWRGGRRGGRIVPAAGSSAYLASLSLSLQLAPAFSSLVRRGQLFSLSLAVFRQLSS